LYQWKAYGHQLRHWWKLIRPCGHAGPYLSVLNWLSLKALSLLVRGREKLLRMPSAR
jgi:hypothetical protein